MWACVYLVPTSQIQARSSIVGSSPSAVDAQQVYSWTFNALINEDHDNTDVKISSNRNTNKSEIYQQKFQSHTAPIRSICYLRNAFDKKINSGKPIKKTILLTVNQKMFAEKHSD